MGLGGGYNLFWRHFSRYGRDMKYMVKLDDSNLPNRPDWLDELVRMAEYFKGRVGMVSFLVPGNDKVWPVQEVEGWRVRPTPTNCSGSCTLISRWVWEQIGLWDEELLGWQGPNRDVGPIYYTREDALFGMLCQMRGWLNLYHEDLDAFRCIGEKDERPEYVRWKNDQAKTALPALLRIWKAHIDHQRTLPHRPPL
jgi:hypothetical protein